MYWKTAWKVPDFTDDAWMSAGEFDEFAAPPPAGWDAGQLEGPAYKVLSDLLQVRTTK